MKENPLLVADTQLYKRLCPSIGPLAQKHESKSKKTRISAPAHPSATGGRVSGLVQYRFSKEIVSLVKRWFIQQVDRQTSKKAQTEGFQIHYVFQLFSPVLLTVCFPIARHDLHGQSGIDDDVL